VVGITIREKIERPHLIILRSLLSEISRECCIDEWKNGRARERAARRQDKIGNATSPYSVRHHRQCPVLGYSPALPFSPRRSTQLRYFKLESSNNKLSNWIGLAGILVSSFTTKTPRKYRIHLLCGVIRGRGKRGRFIVRKTPAFRGICERPVQRIFIQRSVVNPYSIKWLGTFNISMASVYTANDEYLQKIIG
jgi:hypothetical protein